MTDSPNPWFSVSGLGFDSVPHGIGSLDEISAKVLVDGLRTMDGGPRMDRNSQWNSLLPASVVHPLARNNSAASEFCAKRFHSQILPRLSCRRGVCDPKSSGTRDKGHQQLQ